MGIRNRLAAVYDRVPVLKCKELCQDVCGPIPVARDEIRLMERAADRPYGWQVKTGHCTMFDEESGRCRCYRDRPLVCRAWGTVATSVCPFGCEPDRWLTHAEFDDLLVRVTDVAGPQSSPQPYLGDRRATEEEYRQSTQAAEVLLARGLRLPDLWNASRPYVICACCGWRGQSDEHVEPDEFAGEPCPQCSAGVLRMAQPGDRPLFVPKSRG